MVSPIASLADAKALRATIATEAIVRRTGEGNGKAITKCNVVATATIVPVGSNEWKLLPREEVSLGD